MPTLFESDNGVRVDNTQGTAIHPGRMLGRWRRDSTLSWPDLPCPSPKMWEIFRRMMMKAFGTMARVYNPAAEIPLKNKMGKWLRVDIHICYTFMHDEKACYERVGDSWRWYEQDKQTNSFQFQKNMVLTSSNVIRLMGRWREKGCTCI